MKPLSLLLCLGALALGSTATFAQSPKRKSLSQKTPKPALAVTPSAPGLTCVITHRGGGRRAVAGETVLVHYTGLLANGTKFDSSRDRQEPLPFSLGKGAVIKGWDEGIAQLGLGDQAVLVIPPHLGYGAKGAGKVIPPNATLIFLVELVDIQGPALSLTLRTTLEARGLEAALAQYRELKAKEFAGIFTNEADTNGLGYKLMSQSKFKEAIAILELNVERYPASGNAHDSLAEAHMKAGNKAMAIQHYEKSLALDPKNSNAVEMLKSLRNP